MHFSAAWCILGFWVRRKGPTFLLHKSSFLPKLKELPDSAAVGCPGCGQELGDILSRASGAGFAGRCVHPVEAGKDLVCHTAALWLSKNKRVADPTARDRQWEVSV